MGDFRNIRFNGTFRTDKNNPEKTSNIWHLVAIEPAGIFENSVHSKMLSKMIASRDEIVSQDFEMLKRRFDGFLGPAYYSNVIESGIRRIEAIEPPFDKEGVQRINEHMMSLAADREGMKNSWRKILTNNMNPEIVEADVIPHDKWPKKFLFINLLNATLLFGIYYVFIRVLIESLYSSKDTKSVLIGLIFTVMLSYYLYHIIIKILKFISPAQTIKSLGKCIHNTLKVTGDIKSEKSNVRVQSEDETGTYIDCYLENAAVREKRLFAEAMKDLLTSIDNPRYLIIKKGRFRKLNYRYSFACPEIIGSNKENAAVFKKYLEKIMGKMELVYTRNVEGRKHLLKCRRLSYINRNERYVYGKRTVSKWE